jgi:hypothetical protein
VSTGFIVKAAAILTVAGAFFVMRVLAKRRLANLERTGGCVSCGSHNLVVQDHVRTCMDCGYQGRADGGGKLDPSAIDSIYPFSEGPRGPQPPPGA